MRYLALPFIWMAAVASFCFFMVLPDILNANHHYEDTLSGKYILAIVFVGAIAGMGLSVLGGVLASMFCFGVSADDSSEANS